MSIPEVIPTVFFGLRPNIRQNAHFISDFQVLYPAGSVLVLHNYYEKRQKYIKLYDKSCVLEIVAVSCNRKYAAIIENGERGQIIIYDLQALKRRRTLNLPSDSTTNRFETLTFSHDDKYIMAITGEPDWMMISYNWEKGKVDSWTKANYPNSPAIVTQICCSPTDSSEVCLIGPGLFRLLSLSETVWRQYGFQKADQIQLTTACWLTSDKIICGTADGKLLLIYGGELKGAYNAFTVLVINIKEKEDVGTSTSSLTIIKTSSDSNTDEDRQVRSLIAFGKGFAYSCKPGFVHLFEKESPTRYRKKNVFRVVPWEFKGDAFGSEIDTVKHLSINSSQDKLLATTNRAQIYTVRLWGPDLNVAPEIPFKILGEPLHHGPITGLCMCVWKPIFLTCGQLDKTVRLWNYETQSVEMIKQFDDVIYSIALHPTGLFTSIGFTENLRFMVILLSDIQPCKDFPIPQCTLSKFSSHGQYLAAARDATVEVFCHISFHNIFSLKGHTGKIVSMVWSPDDKKLVSCGEDGAIIEWDMILGRKISEVVTEGVKYTDCALSSDGKFIYAVSTDGVLREITESTIIRSVEFNQTLERIVLSRSDVMLFVCGETGTVFSVRIPVGHPAEYTSFFYHFSLITQMKLSYDDQTLVTASAAGAVIIWKLGRTEGKAITMDKDFSYSKDILISKQQLQQKIQSLKDLGVKLFDLEMGHAALMRSRENEYSTRIKDIKNSYNQSINELKEKMELIEANQETELVRMSQEVNELKVKQETEKNDLEGNYGVKLSLEYEKVAALTAEKDEIARRYEEQFLELKESKEMATESIFKMYEKKLIDVNRSLQESYEEIARRIQEHEKVKQHLEEDTDREIVETKARYEKILKHERENNGLFKLEAANMKKKYFSAQKEIEEYRRNIDGLQAEHQRNQSIIQALEKDIQDLKKEITERDMTVEDKDKRIYDLKKKIQELEKYKFVLDYKIKELNNQIDPKDREIKEKKEQIEDMEKELENLHKINTSLELQLKELKEKITATEKEVSLYESKYQSGGSVLRQIKVDIYNLYQYIEDFKMLKDGIKTIYLKYNQDEVLIRGQSMDSDLQKEFMIQREFLEKTIFALQSTISKNKECKKDEGLKVLENNVVLLEELNEMRRQLKETLRKVAQLEELLGVKPGKCVTPREAFNKLQQCLKRQEEIKSEYNRVAELAWRETNDLNARVALLHDKIEALAPDEN